MSPHIGLNTLVSRNSRGNPQGVEHMNYWYWLLIGILLVGCTASSSAAQGFETAAPAPMEEKPPQISPTIPATKTPLPPNPLPYLGQASELTNQVWLNTDAPLRLADLRGKVVLLEMWTFG